MIQETHAPPAAPTADDEPGAFGGVSLAAYATVHAALAEGLDEAQALRAARVDPRAWPDADDAWSQRLADDLHAGGPLHPAYDMRLSEAQARFARPLPPVDRELGPWLDLVRRFAAAEQPLAMLQRLGLRGADMTRLHRAWSARLRDEPGLRTEAAEILARDPGALPRIEVAPPVAAIEPSPSPSLSPAPSHSPSPAPERPEDDAPPLFAPLPYASDPTVATPPSPVAPPPASVVMPSPPSVAMPPLTSTRFSPAIPPSSPSADAIPFSTRGGAPSPAPAPRTVEPRVPTGTMMSFDPPVSTPLPWPRSQGGADLGRTVLATGPIRLGPALPFAGTPGVADPVPSSPEALRKLVSLPVYAAVCAELALHPERAAAVFARYGLADPALRQAVDAQYKADLVADPALRARFEELLARARSSLR